MTECKRHKNLRLLSERINKNMRFAVIDWLDCILFESNDVLDCYYSILSVWGTDNVRGVYDYFLNEYLVLGDIPTDFSDSTLKGGNND